MLLPFYIVSSKFKPIIGLDASCKLGLITIHCPITTSNGSINTPFDAISGGKIENIHKKNIPNILKEKKDIKNIKIFLKEILP